MNICIQLLESPIPAPPAPAPPAAAPPLQKASGVDISGTKRGTVDPLLSKRPEKILNKKRKKKKNGQKWSKWSKWSKMIQNGSKWSKIVQNGKKW